jgi:hypothetical protein
MLGLIISAIVVGLIIGALGRLVLPGRQDMSPPGWPWSPAGTPPADGACKPTSLPGSPTVGRTGLRPAGRSGSFARR